MRGFCQFAIVLCAGWSGCISADTQRVDITAPQADIALQRADAGATDAEIADSGQEGHRHLVVRVFYGMDRSQQSNLRTVVSHLYPADRGRLQFGHCHVSVPDTDQSEDERPDIWQLEFHDTPTRQAMLLGTEQADAREFVETLTADVSASGSGEVFVFVPGNDVSFEQAVRQTARIAHELQFDGAPILYSRPSSPGGRIDQATVLHSQTHLIRFLRTVSRESGASKVHLMAHSTGTQLLAEVLREFSEAARSDDQIRFNEVILTAPDIDAEAFRQETAARIVRVADRVTVYASDDDPDLLRSAEMHGTTRLGQGGPELMVISDVPGIDVVDVAARSFQFLNAGTPRRDNELLGDIRQVINGVATTQRGLQPHPARQLAWRLPSSGPQLISYSQEEPRAEDAEPTQPAPEKTGFWTRLTGWWPD